MTDFVEVYNQATHRNEIIPEDWLDSPVLCRDAEGNLLERVQPVPLAEAEERPTDKSTHSDIDSFAARYEVTFPEDVKTKSDKLAVLDELVPLRGADSGSTVPTLPAAEPGVELVHGPPSTESTIPAINAENQASAEDKEN